jgi:hypothetical protein
MKRSAARRASVGFAYQTLIFILATIGITATATVMIVEAYQKWIVDPKTPSELKHLTDENNALTSKVQQLQEKVKQLEEERVVEAAQVLRLATKANGSAPNHDGVTEAMKRRGLTTDENHLLDLAEAAVLVDNALKQGPSPLDSVFGSVKVEDLRRSLPTYQSDLKARLAAYKDAHPARSSIIQTRIDDATHPDRVDDRP